MKTVTLSRSDEEQRLLIEQLQKVRYLKETANRAKDEYDTKRSAVYDMAEQYMKSKKANKLEFDLGSTGNDDKSKVVSKPGKAMVVSQVKKTVVEWLVDKLLEVLTKSQADKVVHKRYEITNWAAIVQVMKKYGVPAKEVIEHIDVERTVSNDALEQLHSLGEIDQQNLQGCYKVTVKSSYLQMAEVKK